MPKPVQRGEQSSPTARAQPDGRRARTRRSTSGPQARRTSTRSADDQLVVQVGGRQQADHRHRRHPGQRPAVGGAAMGPTSIGPPSPRPGQVGLVQHRHDVGRSAAASRASVLGLERLGDHQDVHVGGRASSDVTVTPARVSAAATVPRPTPSRPSTAMRKRGVNYAR